MKFDIYVEMYIILVYQVEIAINSLFRQDHKENSIQDNYFDGS